MKHFLRSFILVLLLDVLDKTASSWKMQEFFWRTSAYLKLHCQKQQRWCHTRWKEKEKGQSIGLILWFLGYKINIRNKEGPLHSCQFSVSIPIWQLRSMHCERLEDSHVLLRWWQIRILYFCKVLCPFYTNHRLMKK